MTTDNKTRLRIASLLLSALLIFNLLLPMGIAHAADHTGTEKLTDLKIKLSQNGAELSSGNTFDPDQDIKIDLSFGVPIVDTNGIRVIEKNDTITFDLTDSFNLSAPKEVPFTDSNGNAAGKMTFFQDAGGPIQVKIVFDGAALDDPNLTKLDINADITLKYVVAPNHDQSQPVQIAILGATYTLHLPAPVYDYALSKSGSFVQQNGDPLTQYPAGDPRNSSLSPYVAWTIDTSGTKNAAAIALDGYVLKDKIKSSVGNFIQDSFKLTVTKSDTTTEEIIVGGINFATTTEGTTEYNTFEYTLPAIANAKSYRLTYRTKTPDALFLAVKPDPIVNEIALWQGDTNLKTASATMNVPFTLLSKTGKDDTNAGSGGAYNTTNRRLTWTIIANPLELRLEDAVVTDKLLPLKKDEPNPDTDPIFVSATAEFFNPGTGAWQSFKSWATEPNDSRYELGTIDKAVKLTITVRIPDPKPNTPVVENAEYSNTAWLSWKNSGGSVGNFPSTVNMAFNAIEKSAPTLTPEHIKKQEIPWDVAVKVRQQNIPDLAVYELFVYQDAVLEELKTLANVSGIPADWNISADTWAEIAEKQNLGLKFKDFPSSNPTNLTHRKANLTVNGAVVAELVKVSGFNHLDDTNNKFTIATTPVGTAILTGSRSVTNTALLYSANAKLNEASATQTFPENMLLKEMLKRSEVQKSVDTIDILQYTEDVNAAFDYRTKEAIFRISINADALDLSAREYYDAQSRSIRQQSTFTLKDTLPAGWEIVAFGDGSFYKLYEADSSAYSAGKRVFHNGSVPSPTIPAAGFTADIAAGSTEPTFRWTTLDKAYVLLIKAKPKDDLIKRLFSTNTANDYTNTAELSAGNGSVKYNATATVRVSSEILKKGLDTTNAVSGGYLVWTIDYRPADVPQGVTNVTLNDVLDDGINPPLDYEGNLAPEGEGIGAFATIREMVLQPDGSYTEGDEVPVTGNNVLYDAATRKLTFRLDDSHKAYRVVYKTYITGEPQQITNEIRVEGNNNATPAPVTFAITDAHVRATAQYGSRLTVKKLNENGDPLPGATFVLLNSSKTKTLRSFTTGRDGLAYFYALPIGTFVLRESVAPANYLANTEEYTVVIELKNGQKQVSVNGTVVAPDAEYNIYNYKDINGQLRIGKFVSGNLADQTLPFVFSVKFSDNGVYQYHKSDGTSGMIGESNTVSLAHGQRIVIYGIGDRITATVTEQPQNYTPSPSATQSVIIDPSNPAEKVRELTFTNIRRSIGGGGTGGGTSGGGTGGGTDPATPGVPINPPTTPLAPGNNGNTAGTGTNSSETISDNSVPAQGLDSSNNIAKVSSAPKTGAGFVELSTLQTVLIGVWTITPLVVITRKYRRKNSSPESKELE